MFAQNDTFSYYSPGIHTVSDILRPEWLSIFTVYLHVLNSVFWDSILGEITCYNGGFSFLLQGKGAGLTKFHHRTMRLVSTTFTHPDKRWGNHLSKAHLVGVYTLVSYYTGSLITILSIISKMFFWNYPSLFLLSVAVVRAVFSKVKWVFTS